MHSRKFYLSETFSDFGRGEFEHIFAENQQITNLIHDRRVRAVKFTGSTTNGKIIAEQCGLALKKTCFELGSNDAFIVLNDANIDDAVETAYDSRMLNSGQAVVNAKRFIIQSKVYDEFREKLLIKIKRDTVIGDPMDPKTTMGPMGIKS